MSVGAISSTWNSVAQLCQTPFCQIALLLLSAVRYWQEGSASIVNHQHLMLKANIIKQKPLLSEQSIHIAGMIGYAAVTIIFSET